MALIRCPGCRLDTSDSLDTCPYCRTPLKAAAAGSGPPPAPELSQPGSEAAPEPAHRRKAIAPKPSRQSLVKPILGLVLLAAALALPGGIAIAVLALLGYWMLSGRQTTPSTAHREAIRRLVLKGGAQVRRSAGDRPLGVLSRIEEELRKSAERRRA